MFALFCSFFSRLIRGVWLWVALLAGAFSLPAHSASSVVNTPQIRAELLAYAPQGVERGQTLWLGLLLRHQPEWHTYWINPGDSGLATEMSWQLPKGWEVGDVVWPLPRQLKASMLTNYGFEGQVLLAVPVTITDQFKAGLSHNQTVQMHANWLVCRRECIPQEGDFSLTVTTTGSTVMGADEFNALFAQQPKILRSTHTQANVSDASGHALLSLSTKDLPALWQGQSLEVFAQAPEILASASLKAPLAQQAWHGDSWQAQLPLHTLRSTSPNSIKLLVVHSEPTREGVWLEVPISGKWPAASALDATQEVIWPEPAPTPASWTTVLSAMLGALLGGVILNLMPCVLPVLAIKVLHFAQHHESARQRHAQGIAYTLGVVMSFVLLGGALLLLRASGQELGWGFQLQSPWFVMGLCVLFTLIALSLFGLLEIGQWLPASWLSYQSHHPVINAGVSGVLAVVVASPCTAPFMGASLGLAMTLPTTLALLVFASMGVGLALPYALVSAWPRLSRYLPRPGAWMVLLRQFFGFPMLATVIWLVWVLALQTSVNTSLSLWMTLLCLAAALWALRLRSPLGYGVRVVLWLSTSALLVLTMNSIEVSTSPHNEQTTEATAITPRWQAWSQTLVDSELAQGRAVFVDFTAAWCVTCQINKRTVLSSTEVLNAFEQQHVSLLRADWTRRDPAITRALNALGRSGVPVYVLYRPKAPPVVLSELLSQADVLKLLETTP